MFFQSSIYYSIDHSFAYLGIRYESQIVVIYFHLRSAVGERNPYNLILSTQCSSDTVTLVEMS